MFLALLLAFGLLLAGFAGGWKIRGEHVTAPKADTVTIHTTDTCWLPSVPDTVKETITKVVKVPLSDVEIEPGVDSVQVALPFERHHATLEDVADVWYSGYQARIDSAVVYKHHTTEIIRQPYEVARMPRVTLDLGAGAFYGENRVNPYLVGEMRYNAQKTTFSAFGAIDHEGRWGIGVGVTYRINLIK